MINQSEAEICKRRSHSSGLDVEGKWRQCQWCRTWLRTLTTVEEREDDPPANERSSLDKLK